MANPIFKFTLSHAIAGSLLISEPDGWKDAKIKLERHADFHSLIEYFDGTFTFYGDNGRDNGGIDFIRNVEQTYGFDTTLLITITISTDSGYTYQTVFTGQLDLSQLLELENNKLQCPIIRNDLWSKFINRYDTAINIQSITDLDSNSVTPASSIELHLTSQKLLQKYSAYLSNNYSYTTIGNSNYAIIDWDKEDLSEIETIYHYRLKPDSAVQLTDVPFQKFDVLYSGEYQIASLITMTDFLTGVGVVTFESTIGRGKVIFQVNQAVDYFDETDVSIPHQFVVYNGFGGLSREVLAGSFVTEYRYNKVVNLKKGDSIRIYFQQAASPSPATHDNISLFGRLGDSYDDNVLEALGSGDFLGFYDPSSGLFPATKPDGSSIQAGGQWKVTKDGVIQGVQVYKDWIIRAIVNSPGQTVANWVANRLAATEGLFRFGQTYLNINASTVFQTTDAAGFLLHDVAGSISDRIIGQSNSFYSEYLGSTLTNYRTYLSDGCKWANALIKGLQIRGYYLSNKLFSLSFKNWWEGANPIFNLGLGYDTINGNEVIRIEQQSDFFINQISFNINYVKAIQRSYDNDYIFNKVEVGYNNWQSEDASGIDDPQTNHTYASPIKKSGKTLTLKSDFIAASLAIETTRRTSRIQSTDYKYDNNIFIIAINPNDTSPETYDPELNENFTSITNLLNPETRYNSELTPARNLLRWMNYINGCLQSYLSSTGLKFVLGEGNYSMISALSSSSCNSYTASLSEKQDILATNDYLFIPLAYEIEIDMQWGDYQTIRDNRNMAIGISQTNSGHNAFFIKTLEYDICHSKCKIVAWAKNYLQITNTDFVGQPLIACDVYRITEEDEVRLLESGEKRIIE